MLPNQLSPFMGESYKRMLGDQYDDRIRDERAAEDAESSDPGRAFGRVFGRMQADAANGPMGFNRQWIPFFEALRGSKVRVGSLDLPTHTESSGPSESDAMTSLRATNPTNARLDELRARSSLRDPAASVDSAVPESVPASPTRYAGSVPNYYASLASLKRGR